MNGRSRQYFQHLLRSVWRAVCAWFSCGGVRSLVQDCSGGITAIVGLSLGMLLMAFACATTLGEANVVKSDLQSAVDAAVLAGARSNDTSTKTTRMQAVFWLNFARNGASGGTGPGGSVVTITSLEASDKTVSMTASATVSIIPYTHAFDLPVRASASAQASTTGVEMALVIDNTGSLGHSGMQATRDGAKALIKAVLPDDSVKDTWISIVPFGAVVNFGPTHTNWLSSSFNEEAYSPTSWEGCMMARTDGGHDRDDATPSEAPFDAFIHPSTYPQWGRFGWTYTSGGNSVVLASPSRGQKPGDNSWDRSNPASISETYNYPESPSYPGSSIYTANASNPIGWFATGPNLGCPYQPIVPETSDQATLLAAIDNMRMVWRGGTMINTGLQAGWLTISSNWQGWWGDADLPQATGKSQKVIVLMTDGTNGWTSVSGQGLYPDANGDGDMTAYGRLSDNTLGASGSGSAYVQLNAITSELCTNIKAQGITIYVLLFNHSSSVDTTTQNLMEGCATSGDTYFVSPDAASLQATFSQIGSQIANVMITK